MFSKIHDRLMEYDPKDISTVTFKGLCQYARVIKVYDGDTITCLFEIPHLNDFPIKISCRMAGYDSPELRSTNKHVVESAKEARQYLNDLIYDKIIWLEFQGNDKYKRPLINAYTINNDGNKDVCINEEMLRLGYGKPYHGEKKEDESIEE